MYYTNIFASWDIITNGIPGHYHKSIRFCDIFIKFLLFILRIEVIIESMRNDKYITNGGFHGKQQGSYFDKFER